MKPYQLCGLGNAIVDIFVEVSDEEYAALGFERGEPFLDPWVSEWSLGYPVWLSYQPVPHLAAAGVLKLFHAFADPAAIFVRACAPRGATGNSPGSGSGAPGR